MASHPPPPSLAPSGAPSGPFELSGGALCLDFVNTWGDRDRPESDQLKSYADLLAFAAQTGLTPEPQRDEPSLREPVSGERSASAFAVALRLRESLYWIFAARARGQAAPPADIAILNAALKEALAHLRLEAQPAAPDATFAWGFEPVPLPTAPLWPIARSAADLLVSPDLARVTQCDGSACTWLFLDRSRTHTRRWCSMESCGNRAKARRHYRRSKD